MPACDSFVLSLGTQRFLAPRAMLSACLGTSLAQSQDLRQKRGLDPLVSWDWEGGLKILATEPKWHAMFRCIYAVASKRTICTTNCLREVSTARSFARGAQIRGVCTILADGTNLWILTIKVLACVRAVRPKFLIARSTRPTSPKAPRQLQPCWPA